MHSTIDERPQLLDAMDGAITMYHPGTAKHAARVRDLAELIGAELGVTGVDAEALPWAALLHDLGKLGVPHTILSKPGPLTEAEWVEIRRHPVTGAQLLLSLSPALSPIAAGIRSHHERWDASGYPDGTAGEAIPLIGRILAVADTFDAMTDFRSYRERHYSRDDALAEIRAGSGVTYDPSCAGALLDLEERGLLPHAS